MGDRYKVILAYIYATRVYSEYFVFRDVVDIREACLKSGRNGEELHATREKLFRSREAVREVQRICKNI